MFNSTPPSLRLRTLGILAAGGVSLALMAAGAPQCVHSGDEILSPSLSSSGQPEDLVPCHRECAMAANDARRAETDRFLEALRGCDPGTDCRAREAALHVSIMQNITETEQYCMSGCHNQGRGHGGN